MNFMTSFIPVTHPLNTPKTIQTLSSLFDSLLDSYAMLLIFVGFKSCLFFTGWLSMKLVIFLIMLHMFGSDLSIYGSNIKSIKSIYHSDLQIHQFSSVAHHFPTMALYSHGDTIPLVFSATYDNIYNILYSFKSHFRIWKVL